VFWLIEIGLFAVVVFLVLNSANEVLYAYDTPAIFKLHFFSLEDFMIRSVIFNMFLFLITVMLMLNYRGRMSLLWICHALVAFLFIYLVYVEFSIFQTYLNYIGFSKWIFSVDTYESSLESDVTRNRVLHGFILFSSVVKFWHFALIAIV
jgi:hypothetical protein